MPDAPGWRLERTAAERYEAVLVPAILGPAARALVGHADPSPGDDVLDVGCGTGSALGHAASVGRAGRLAGVDVNGAMIEVARERFDAEWHVADATALPFADDVFDVVLSAQVLQFLKDRPAALDEAARVLRPGGRIAIGLWCELAENPYFESLVAAVATHVAPDTAAQLGAAFGLSDPAVVAGLLHDAGFAGLEMGVDELWLTLPPAEDFVPRHIAATPMAAGVAAAGEDAGRRVVREVAATLAHAADGGGLRVPFRSRWIVARVAE